MASSSPNSGTKAEQYVIAENTVVVSVTAQTQLIVQSEQIARYFTEDLLHLVNIADINIAKELQVPDGYSHAREELIEMLYDDLSHMLRNGLITGIHLLLSEPEPDKNVNAYVLRYHAQYLIDNPERSLKTGASQSGGVIAPPKNIWSGARFVLLIDWNANVGDQHRDVRRPEYLFDWVPEEGRYDGTMLVRYRDGGMTVNGATVERREFTLPKALKK